MPTALITGITGQDGSYLAELLLEKNYTVYGIIRRASTFNTSRIEHLYSNDKLILRYADMTDISSLLNVLQEIAGITKHFEIYNLAAQSHVQVSFELPLHTAEADGLGVLNLLEAVKTLQLIDRVKLYQASTSELYGAVLETPQTETTPFNPRSPYAAAKLYAFWITKNYRDAYNFFISNGILFNHCSPRRGHTFLVRKVTRAVARIKLGLQDELVLGNLDSARDWGDARDYVRAMWLMLQQEEPDDYVIASGKQYTIRQVVELAFAEIGVVITWFGDGVSEVGKDNNGNILVRVSEKYYRPTEVDTLLGDPSKARKELDWKPEYTFPEQVKEMVAVDLIAAQNKSLYAVYSTLNIE